MSITQRSGLVIGIGLLLRCVTAFGVSSTPASSDGMAGLPGAANEPRITRTYVVHTTVVLSTGARQTISETVACAGERQRVRSGWRYTREAINAYTIFPNREVVIAYLPQLCLSRDGIVPARFTPLVVWIDDAASPSVMEFIVHHSYFERAKYPRVRITELKVERSDKALVHPTDARFSTIDDKYDDGHLSFAQSRPSARDLDSIFYGVTANIYPESVWRRFTSLAQRLEGLSETTLIEWPLIRSSAPDILGSCAVAEQGAGPGIDCSGFDRRPYSHALVLRGNVWSLDQSAVGVERYFLLRHYDAVKEGCTTNAKSCEFNRYRFPVVWGSQKFEMRPHESRFVFEPKDRTLTLLAPSLFATRTMNGRRK